MEDNLDIFFWIEDNLKFSLFKLKTTQKFFWMEDDLQQHSVAEDNYWQLQKSNTVTYQNEIISFWDSL